MAVSGEWVVVVGGGWWWAVACGVCLRCVAVVVVAEVVAVAARNRPCNTSQFRTEAGLTCKVLQGRPLEETGCVECVVCDGW